MGERPLARGSICQVHSRWGPLLPAVNIRPRLHGSTPPATGELPALPRASAVGDASPAEGSLHGSTPPATGELPALPRASAVGDASPAEGSWRRAVAARRGLPALLAVLFGAVLAPAAAQTDDSLRPEITRIRIVSDEATYTATAPANEIDFEVEFSGVVGSLAVAALDGGLAPVAGASLAVDVGGRERLAPCRADADRDGTADPAPDDELICTLRVVDGMLDTDGVATAANPLRFDIIEDEFGNDLALSFPSQSFPHHRIDAVAPTITGASIRVPRARAGASIVVELRFSENVRVTGMPEVTLTIERDNEAPQEWTATYARSSGRVVEFRHLLSIDDVDDHSDAEGADNSPSVGLGDDAVEMVAGITDEAGNGAEAKLPEARPESSLRYLRDPDPDDDTAPWDDTARPTVIGAALLAPGGRLGIDATIAVEVLFSKPVSLSGATVALTIGSQTEHLSLAPTSPTTSAAHRFERSLEALEAAVKAELPASGPLRGGVRALAIVLEAPVGGSGGGSILDAGDRGWINQPEGEIEPGQSRATRISLSPRGSAVVDTERPTVKDVQLLEAPAPGASADGRPYYGSGDRIRIRVTMSEDVRVSLPHPSLPLALGSTPVTARYKGMEGRRALVFDYVVEQTDVDRDGIAVNAPDDAFDSVTDMAGNACMNDPDVPSDRCGFSDWAGTYSPTHLVDGALRGRQGIEPGAEQPPAGEGNPPPAGSPVVRSVDVPEPGSGYFRAGDTLAVEVQLDPAVSYTATPELILTLDAGETRRVPANERAGPGRRRLTFDYRVRDGDEDLNGIDARLSGAFTLATGAAWSGGAVPLRNSIRVDARGGELVEPVRITSDAGADDAYIEGNVIRITAVFSEPVRRRSGTEAPTLTIDVGGRPRIAELESPRAVAALSREFVFAYRVAAGDADADGIAIAANSVRAMLEDAAGNEANTAHAALPPDRRHRVDTTAPAVVGIALGSADGDSVYVPGERITATVTFSEAVDVGRGAGAAGLELTIGDQTRIASYASGNRSGEIVFAYTVQAGDGGRVYIAEDAFRGAIRDLAGNVAGGVEAMDFPHTVTAAAASAGAVALISDAGADGTYIVGDVITAAVTFDDTVTVTAAANGPTLALTVGDATRLATYAAGSGSREVRFAYRVATDDEDEDGVSVAASSIHTGSGAIEGANGLAAALRNMPLPHQPRHKVDGVAPAVTGIEITSKPAAGDAYLVGETVAATLTFDERIAVAGRPTLTFAVGGRAPRAACARGRDPTALECSYTVAVGDFDNDGVGVVAESLSGGTIRDVPGNAASLAHPALADDPSHKVHGAPPESVRAIPALRLAAGGGSRTEDLAAAFAGFGLRYSAVSSDDAVATASVSGATLAVTAGVEGTAEITVTATNSAGRANASFLVTVTTDAAEKAALNDTLAAVGRSMLASAAGVIGSRIDLAHDGARVTLGGRRLDGIRRIEQLPSGRLRAAALARRAPLRERRAAARPASSGIAAHRMLGGSAFHMPLNGAGGARALALWGAGDLSAFEGDSAGQVRDGSASAGYLGVDARGGDWLAGVAVSRSVAEADYDFEGEVPGSGTLETTVTGFHPYARLDLGADGRIWAIGGFGAGDAALARSHVAAPSPSSDLVVGMAIGGLKRALALEFAGSRLAARVDAGFLGMETDSGNHATDGLSARVSRLRMGLEAAWDGGPLAPFVEMSGRFDGGDGQSGSGLELAGGMRLGGAASGLGLEARGRVLALRSGDGYRDGGVSVTARFEPGRAGRGIAFHLSPRWGGATAATDLFWDRAGGVHGNAGSWRRNRTWAVDAAFGYGFGLRSMPGLVTPFGEADVSGDDRRIRLGIRFDSQGSRRSTQFEVSSERLSGSRREAPEMRTLIRWRARI